LAFDLDADERMEDRLQPGARRRIVECGLAHAWAIERAVDVDEGCAERRADGVDRRAARQGQPAGDEVGVDDDGAEAGEHRSDGALAAADAAGQTDAQGSHASSARGIGLTTNAASRERARARRT